MSDNITPAIGNIVWLRPDGGVSVDSPQIPGVDLEKWRDELIKRGGDHADYTCVGINLVLPPRDEFRNAWTFSGKAVAHDMTRAADLRREQLRRERAPALAALDVEYQRADERGDAKAKSAVAARKQALRDVTDHPGLASAKTLDDLRAVKLP